MWVPKPGCGRNPAGVSAPHRKAILLAVLTSFTAALLGTAVPCGAADGARLSYPPVTADRPLAFPADYGSHPQFRTEWWYVTGWLTTARGEPLGFQITFFRTRPDIDESNPSAFTPRQLLIAHCAISDPKRGRLWQDQRIRRAGLGLADAKTGDTDVSIDRWALKRGADGYTARVHAEDFSFDLAFAPTQAVLINGDGGVSRKGPAAQAASYYYSVPHLRVSGSITRRDARDAVTGEAWLDHEWSSDYLDAQAVGWDWIGINLDDGAALMAFRIRGGDGAARWSGGTLRDPEGHVRILESADVEFSPGRRWRSPRTGISYPVPNPGVGRHRIRGNSPLDIAAKRETSYPVQWRVRAGSRELELRPLLDDQENDTRLSTGAIYWEGRNPNL